jgi:iron(III) transport system substrate-binding protein
VQTERSQSFPGSEGYLVPGWYGKVKTKIAGEVKAKKIGADVLMVADPSYYLALKKQGLLMDYVAPNQKDVVADKDARGSWTAVRISNMIIAYNTTKLKPEEAPKSWKDLLDPRFKGKIAMPSPMLSGTAYVAAGALSDKYGWEYFDKLKANGLRLKKATAPFRTNC